MKKKYTVGIVGFGYMGKIRAQVVAANPDLKLIGISDIKLYKKEIPPDCNLFRSYKDLINEGNPDIIFVCTPNCFSPEIAIYALNQKKHVFCEKPPGRNLEDVKKIITAEKENNGAKLMFGFNHRYHPGIIESKNYVDSGKYGKILWLRGFYGKSGGQNFANSWKNTIKLCGGGILLDQGIHMLDLMRYFCGDFIEVKSMISNSFWKFEIEDNAFILMRTKEKQIAMLHSSSTLWKHTFKIEIFLEHGYLIVSGLLSKTGSYGREMLTIGKRQFEAETFALGNPREEVIYFDQDKSWEMEVNYFVDCIKKNKLVLNSSSADALAVMEIIDKSYKDDHLNYNI